MSLPTSVSGNWENRLYVPPYICLWSLVKISCMYLPTYVLGLLWKSPVCTSLHMSLVSCENLLYVPPYMCLWSLGKSRVCTSLHMYLVSCEKRLNDPPYICLVIGKSSCMSLPTSVPGHWGNPLHTPPCILLWVIGDTPLHPTPSYICCWFKREPLYSRSFIAFQLINFLAFTTVVC